MLYTPPKLDFINFEREFNGHFVLKHLTPVLRPALANETSPTIPKCPPEMSKGHSTSNRVLDICFAIKPPNEFPVLGAFGPKFPSVWVSSQKSADCGLSLITSQLPAVFLNKRLLAPRSLPHHSTGSLLCASLSSSTFTDTNFQF